MVEIVKAIGEAAVKGIERLAEASKEVKTRVANLDKPLNDSGGLKKSGKSESSIKDAGKSGKIEGIKRMEPQIVETFVCPAGADKAEFIKQIKAQERGLNNLTIAEYTKNRRAFEYRKAETGNGRDLSEGKKAQEHAREKAMQSRIESNQKKGMPYEAAKSEAQDWLKTQAALHNPDQIAGGDPSKVSRMGDSDVNSSIGAQWRTRVPKIDSEVNEYAKGRMPEELENTKMNVKLEVV